MEEQSTMEEEGGNTTMTARKNCEGEM